MEQLILLNNRKKRIDRPLWQLICFSMFCFWQMGFIYFMGPSLTIEGRTPLPISMDNITMLIAAGYVLSILWMIFLPRLVIWAERITAVIALLSVLGLFFSLPVEALKLLIYIQAFCCCFMIGFEAFIIINYFTERSAILYMTVAYGVSCMLIAAVQNDFIPITFPIFRFITVGALMMMLVFFFCIPGDKKSCPDYVKKEDGLTAPEKLMTGTFILVFVSALMAVSGPAISGEVSHGVFITYCVDALAGFLIYLLYKKAGIHPFRAIPVCIGLGCIGFMLMYTAKYVPVLSYVACGLIGFGMVPCQMLPLYGLVLMKSYPSRYLSPIIIGLSLVAVLVQSSMVEMFRSIPMLLYLAYAVIMVILAFIYLQIEPFLLYTLERQGPETAGDSIADPAPPPESGSINVLSKRELEVVELIGYGYSNRDIAKILFISEHTVKDHTKKIYRKMNVHSRFELAALVNRIKANEEK